MAFPTKASSPKPEITFIEQDSPIDEYGRALYAVARSIVRAHMDAFTNEDLTDLNTPLADVRLRQLAKVARLNRDLGARGDGFEWAVHEAVLGKEPRVLDPMPFKEPLNLENSSAKLRKNSAQPAAARRQRGRGGAGFGGRLVGIFATPSLAAPHP